jgi:fengycin family lipopeptide synthetase B
MISTGDKRMAHYTMQSRIRAAVAGITGHNANDLDADLFLESDLGIDSIKMVELTQHLMLLVPEEQREAFINAVPSERLMQVQTLRELDDIFGSLVSAPEQVAAHAAAAAPPLTGAKGPVPATAAPAIQVPQVRSATPDATLTASVFAMIAGVTGHHPQDLDAGLFLESDLGIDSIKMVELAQGLLLLVPVTERDAFVAAVPTQKILQIATLGEMVKLLAPWQGGAAVSVAAASLPVTQVEVRALSSAQPSEVEILYSQYPFLVGHWAVSTCSLVSRVRLQGPFDLTNAQRTWSDLLVRHPSLRSRFSIPADASSFNEYRLQIQSDVAAPALAVNDIRYLNAAQQDAAVADKIEHCVNHEWQLDGPWLHRFFVYRLADHVHEVFFHNHHLISDGLSNQQVMREFLVLYEANATRRPADLPPAISMAQYREATATINAWHDEEEDKALVEFIRAQGKQSFFWNPDKTGRASRRAQVKNYRFHVDGATTQRLIELTRTLRVPINTLLIAAYLRTISAFGNAPDTLFLNIPTSGRVYPGVDASGVVGCFAQNLALGFARPPHGEDWHILVQRVQQEVSGAISAGYDRTQTRQAALYLRDRLQLENGRVNEAHAGMIRAGMKSNLYLPYIGNTHIASQYGPLQVIDYQAATVTNAGTLDTVIELFQRSLTCATNFDSNYYKADFVARIADEFLAQLRDLACYQTLLNPIGLGAVTRAADSTSVAQILQVAEEVIHQALRSSDLDKDLEADLGLDSLERIRIVSRLEYFVGKVDRQALLACRTLNEMAMCMTPPAVAVDSMSALSATASNDIDALPYLGIVAQCRRTPEAIAVLTETDMLSYGQLHRQSNQLAHLLRGRGVGRGVLVGVMLNRGPHMLVAIMAVLKAGGAYVPLDPDYPDARLSYMLEHAKIATVLLEQAVAGQLAACLSPLLALRTLVFLDEPIEANAPSLTTIGRSAWNSYPEQDPDYICRADDPMVVLYTSGSTGKPKGVVLAHRGYANRFDWMQEMFSLRANERVAQKTSICFDISVWELFWPLMVGATVCPVQTAVLRDPWRLAQWVHDTRVDVMHFVPSLFGEFLNAIEQHPFEFQSLRQLVFSGEALPVTYVRGWMNRFGQRIGMANLYGPTEASIDVTAHRITEIPGIADTRIPIGHAMPNVHLLILDNEMQPLATGVVGELWIGGVQLAQGYLHDIERSAESFRPNPFPYIPGPYLYRTGDLAVQLQDGSFDYRGRIDNQIKIRGYRVELGEIEAVLCTHPAVREAAVVALDYDDGHLRLSAWLCGQHIEARELREFLSQFLPHYMLPHRFDWLSSMPKSQNGKLDRNALIQLAKSGPANSERLLADNTTVALDRVMTSTADFPVSPAQHWLLSYFAAPHQWAGFSRFQYLQPLDLELFNQALSRLAMLHPALRSVFYQKDGHWHQKFPELVAPLKAEYYDGSHLRSDERKVQLRQLISERVDGLRIDDGSPLWSVLIVKESESRYDICMLGHHIIGDMLSNKLLFKALWEIYSELLRGGLPNIEIKKPSFVDYLETLEKERMRETQSRYVDYWTSHFQVGEPIFAIPIDHNAGPNIEASSASVKLALSLAEHEALQRLRQHHGCGVYPLLLAPLYRLLAEWSGRSRVVLSHRTHGRDFGDGRSFFDCIGNFAVNYPLAMHVGSAATWDDLVTDIRQEFENVPLNGVSYDLVGARLSPNLYPDNRLTQVRANYLGNRDIRKSTLFEFDREEWDQRFSLPEQQRISLIEVFFSSSDGAMQVDFNYSSNFHTPATIDRIGQRYLELARDMLVQSIGPTASAGAIASTATSLTQVAMAPAMQIPPSQQFFPQIQVPLLPLTGKIAIVTGAGRGIGRNIATTLARQGARIALVSRSKEQLDEALDEVRRLAPESIGIIADVTQQDQVEVMVRQVMSQLGGIDILVNNAGANRSSLLVDSDPEVWKQIIDINLIGNYLCCRSAIPHMIARGSGKIINLGSAASVIGYPLFTAYSASKHAVIGLTKALAEELKQHNIQVNAICPAFVDTRMTPQAFRSNSIPTEHIAEVVFFLASPQSSGITGESINIFGKQDMYSYGSEKLNLIQAMTKDFQPGIVA